MAKWQRTIRLNPEWDQCRDGIITIQSLASSIAQKLSLIRDFSRDRMTDPSEIGLIRTLANWPRIVEGAAEAHEPHRLAFYLYDLAADLGERNNLARERPEVTARMLAELKAHVRGALNNGVTPGAVTLSTAKRCNRPISTGLPSSVLRTQACSHNSSVGQTRAHMPPRGLASRMALAAPRTLPSAMRWMKLGTSMLVGQAVVHGASWQYRHRSASTSACAGVSGLPASANRSVY